jgi:hypothetical protein
MAAPFNLADFRGKKLVMYFYPMDDTPGCTKQACSLRDASAEIAARGAAILGVSAQGAGIAPALYRKIPTQLSPCSPIAIWRLPKPMASPVRGLVDYCVVWSRSANG